MLYTLRHSVEIIKNQHASCARCTHNAFRKRFDLMGFTMVYYYIIFAKANSPPSTRVGTNDVHAEHNSNEPARKTYADV
jgi:hypothetical protein